MTDVKKKYACFVCLQESVNSGVCSNCGAEIEVLDFSVSVIQPPMKGEVCVPCDSDFIRELLHSLISELHGVYHDNFLVDESLGCINIKCDDIAGGRLVLRLNEELSKRGGDELRTISWVRI